jgi:branched-chain amino acid transport system substrate-binding protein
MKVRRIGAAALTMVLVGGLIAACSSSKNSGTSPSKSSGTTSTSGPDVVVGAIGDYTGAFASGEGGISKVLDAWTSTINAAGGLNGHQVKVIAKDAGGSAGANVTAAHELITQDHAVAIIDTDFGDSAWLSYATAQKVPVILGYPSTNALGDVDAFPIMGSAFATTYGLATLLGSHGKTIGVAYCSETCGQQAKLFPILAKAVGLNVGVFISASSTAPDYTGVCQAFKDKNVGSYELDFSTAPYTKIVDTCFQQGVTMPTVIGGYSTSATWKTDKAFQGLVAIDGVAPFFDTTTPGQQAYRGALSKYASSIPGSGLDNSWSAFAWTSAQLVAAAAKNATGTLTAATLTSGLYGLKNETLGGLAQPLNYVVGQPTNLSCYFTWKISGGAFADTPSGDSPTCVPAAALAPIIAALSPKH